MTFDTKPATFVDYAGKTYDLARAEAEKAGLPMRMGKVEFIDAMWEITKLKTEDEQI